MSDYALVLNAGSSSLKFSVYQRQDDQNWRLSSRGQIEGIGTSPRITAKDAEGQVAGEVQDGNTALECLVAWLLPKMIPVSFQFIQVAWDFRMARSGV